MNKIYFVATAHSGYREREFQPGDTVIDPWRMIPDQTGVIVRRLGENRPTLISVLVPTRGRPYKMHEVLRTAVSMATFPRSLEFVAYLDDDDTERNTYLTIQQNTWSQFLRFVTGPRQLLSKCWNDCAALAGGEILMHGGDDIVFTTPGWDVQVRNAFDASQDKILLVQGDDLSPNREALATHGFVHRRWIETVGYFLPPLFSCDWNDVWLTEVADDIGRRVMLPFVTEHQHYSFGKRAADQTDAEREERGRRDDVVELFKQTKPQRLADAKKLRTAMA